MELDFNMKCTKIDDLVLIKSFSAQDLRGTFNKFWMHSSDTAFAEVDFKEAYYSRSKKNVIRGMHFQSPPYDHDKLVVCLQGSVIDVILDLRKNSNTYLEHRSFKLDPGSNDAVFIPKGYAHGFKALSDETLMLYMVSSEYNPKYDSGILYSSFGFDWGEIDVGLISERDKGFPLLKDY